MANATTQKTTTNKASKATATTSAIIKASETAEKAAEPKQIILGHTAEVVKMIADLNLQLTTYEEKDISKALLKEISLFKGFTTDLNSTEKNQSEYNQKQAARLAAIYEKLNDIDEKKEKAAQKEAEAAKYAGLDKLTVKQNKAFADYILKLNESGIKKLNKRQIVNTMQVGQFLEMLDNKKIIIPPIQRGKVWNEQQVIDLLDTLLFDYPLPALTTLTTNGQTAPKLIDGLQRLSTMFTICEYLENNEQDILLDHVKAAYIDVVQITIDDSSIDIENEVFRRLNNGTQMSKAVVCRNNTNDKNSFFAVRDSLKNIASKALASGINLNKSGQIDGLAMYALAQLKAEKVTSLAPKSNSEMLNNFKYSDSDIATIKAAFASIDKVIDILAATDFKGNIYNQNTLASCIYALLKLNATAEKIAANLQAIYTNKQGEPSKNACDKWSATTKSGGTSSSNIEARAKLLIK